MSFKHCDSHKIKLVTDTRDWAGQGTTFLFYQIQHTNKQHTHTPTPAFFMGLVMYGWAPKNRICKKGQRDVYNRLDAITVSHQTASKHWSQLNLQALIPARENQPLTSTFLAPPTYLVKEGRHCSLYSGSQHQNQINHRQMCINEWIVNSVNSRAVDWWHCSVLVPGNVLCCLSVVSSCTIMKHPLTQCIIKSTNVCRVQMPLSVVPLGFPRRNPNSNPNCTLS